MRYFTVSLDGLLSGRKFQLKFPVLCLFIACAFQSKAQNFQHKEPYPHVSITKEMREAEDDVSDKPALTSREDKLKQRNELKVKNEETIYLTPCIPARVTTKEDSLHLKKMIIRKESEKSLLKTKSDLK